ncbi:hypothetical protein CROQUDRAFT_36384 [Cronartium quercuum f. sp. fusiforme G11]|uniref:Kynurenine 3-monooxygenase n=1 Tax=Cronartium quercuum f. sp. fusiforme G11 TaxID=708437 RepID=A0A9P6NYD6_9BASI|nr:hypothetical protein CROQUDRAFT_36384 [Cronartium quercuum f. sp. fusiforme G11]
MSEQPQHAVVVGAGLVGCLAACMLESRGWTVDIYEARKDFRIPSNLPTRARSINLAFSARGIEAIRSIDSDMVNRLLQKVIPMKARMIHHPEGKLNSQPYGLDGEHINSIDRNLLNQALLTEASKRHNIEIHFGHKFLSAQFDDRYLIFWDETTKTERHVKADLTIGADGSYSRVRQQIMKKTRLDFSQEYIDDLYIELSIPPATDKVSGEPTFALDPHHLHIWPRHSFMLIALPNQDKSFTCTLFGPFKGVFDQLEPPTTPHDEARIICFFRKHFLDALELMESTELIRCFAENPRGSLLTIKCNPYHYKDKAVILGDAAHSMVPFYGKCFMSITNLSLTHPFHAFSIFTGQGMNCGLEDVRKLSQLLDDHSLSLEGVLERYSSTRHQDLIAICDLAIENYKEMRDKVTRVDYVMRKALDGILAKSWFLKGKWLPLYTMVTFRPDLDYSEVVKREARQSKIVNWMLRLFATSAFVGFVVVSKNLSRWKELLRR